jgi:hypothetical protein
MFDSSMNNNFDFSLCKSLGVMILFIIMKEIRGQHGSYLGLEPIVIMRLVLKGCTKGSIMSFSSVSGSIQVSNLLAAKSPESSQRINKYLMH